MPPIPLSPTVKDRSLDPATAETQHVSSQQAELSASRAARGLPAAHAPSLSEVRAGDGLIPPAGGGSDRYDAEALLGVGGMGEVLLQFDRRIGRHVALKTIRGGRQSASALVRFLREARVQGQLEHPAIVPVYDLATNDAGEPYFTMKRVHGRTLARVIEELASGDEAALARHTRRKLLTAFAQVCLAVEYAHQRGVFHRDLKPSNIMLGDFGEVYVLDWGLAKLSSEVEPPTSTGPVAVHLAHDIPNVTACGDVVGTPLYMPPEQLRGAEVDARADVFSLGAILFELLTLTPFRRADSVDRLMDEAAREPDRASSRASDVPPELDAACARALENDVAARTITAAELAQSIERYLEGDRDLAMRRALADEHLATARAKLEKGTSDPKTRVAAMREAMRALVLRPDDAETQQLLMTLVVDGEGALPPDAEGELDARAIERRREVGRLGIYGCLSWLACLPIAVWLGIRDWVVPGLLTCITVLTLVIASALVRTNLAASRWVGIVLACATAVVIALTSCWLGPFVLVPVTAVSTGIMFIIHSTRAERKPFIALFVASVLVPFVLERLHVFPPAYSFTNDGLMLLPRALALPENGTLLALAYTSVSYVVLVLLFVARMRDSQQQAERRLFVQAWYLRQLFPASAARLHRDFDRRFAEARAPTVQALVHDLPANDRALDASLARQIHQHHAQQHRQQSLARHARHRQHEPEQHEQRAEHVAHHGGPEPHPSRVSGERQLRVVAHEVIGRDLHDRPRAARDAGDRRPDGDAHRRPRVVRGPGDDVVQLHARQNVTILAHAAAWTDSRALPLHPHGDAQAEDEEKHHEAPTDETTERVAVRVPVALGRGAGGSSGAAG